jgi:hypothetical protein
MTATKIFPATLVLLVTFSGQLFAYQGQDKTFVFSGAYVPAQESYNLDGTGFSGSSGPVSGSGYSSSVRWNRSEASWAFEYLNVDSQHSSPSGLTPASVESQFQRYHLSYRPFLGDAAGGSGLMWDFGLEIRQRKAEQTTPNVFIPSHDSMGGRIGVAMNFNEGSAVYFETAFGFYVPLYHDERSAKTGYYKFSINPDLKFNAIYDLTEKVALSAGLHVIYEQIYYSGTGARGTSKGSETFMNLQIPLEIRFQF